MVRKHLLLAMALLLAACVKPYDGTKDLPPTLTGITVTPGTASIASHTTQQFKAIVNGTTADVTSSVTWSSSTPTTATVNATGLVTAVHSGTTTLTATLNGITGSTAISVYPAWTWVSGSNTVNATGAYGTKGMAAATNVPGNRYGGNSWSDAAGNLWLFGGLSSGLAYQNDLWKWDGTNWTWVSGSSTANALGVYGTLGTPATTNVPGARRASISWSDAAGNMWLFGGYGYGSTATLGYLNDLWKWDGTNWTWVSGSSTINATGVYGTQGTAAAGNVPGSRIGSISWADAVGNLWMFGGVLSPGTSYINDLWKFTPSTGLWTWVSGSSTVNALGVYGTQGVAATTNVPGARDVGISWVDAADNLWMFGGSGYGSVGGATGYMNDLWKYSPSTGLWTWVNGSNTVGVIPGVYGTQGVAAAANVPGSRGFSFSWADAAGNLWLFGGYGYGSTTTVGFLNDLWKWDGTQWTWVSGGSTTNILGVYGTQGIPATTNVPGAKESGITWTDAAGNLWMFGGWGYSSAGAGGWLNDLWKYAP